MLLRQTVVLTATGSGEEPMIMGFGSFSPWLGRRIDVCWARLLFCDRREIVYVAPEPVKLFGPEIFTAWALSKQFSGILFTFLPFLVCFSSFVFVSGARFLRVFLARDYGALAQSRLVMSSLIVNRVLRRLLRWRVSSLVLGGNAYLASSWLRKDVISLPAYDVLYASSFSFVALSAPLTGASSASTLLILNMSLSASRLVVLLLLLPPVSVS
ncbi:hypothetical protein F2Q68_00030864 [Brassica cretica]|uniref:Uncharacterized protein n=1 Tax=Brassica cretica TaxID=69181 RepID=A0A8S9G5M7_BRACR|nr:hypothetical protein F2Q68_00030864 [Brassica cretica]